MYGGYPVVPTSHYYSRSLTYYFHFSFRLCGIQPLWHQAFVASPLWHQPSWHSLCGIFSLSGTLLLFFSSRGAKIFILHPATSITHVPQLHTTRVAQQPRRPHYADIDSVTRGAVSGAFDFNVVVDLARTSRPPTLPAASSTAGSRARELRYTLVVSPTAPARSPVDFRRSEAHLHSASTNSSCFIGLVPILPYFFS